MVTLSRQLKLTTVSGSVKLELTSLQCLSLYGDIECIIGVAGGHKVEAVAAGHK